MKEEDSSDIGALWREALEKHVKEADLKPALERQMKPQMGWGISSILQEQNRQLEILSKTRYSGTILDKLRSAIGRNSAVIVGVTTQIVNAASSPYELQAAIPSVLMIRKIGHASDFQIVMDEIFKGCMAAFSDKDGWNDHAAFRLLAKVLASIPGLERDAQISISLQFSFVNKKILNAQSGSPDSAGEGQQTVAKVTNSSRPDDTHSIPETDITKPSVANGISTSTETRGEKFLDDGPKQDQDLLDEGDTVCNGCNDIFRGWNNGDLYLCVICTDADLCTECYNKIQTSNRGGEWTEWQTFCGAHHRYIKGPMKDWKGVKDGVIRFGE